MCFVLWMIYWLCCIIVIFFYALFVLILYSYFLVCDVTIALQTSTETINKTRTLAREIGKEYIICKDTPGFVVNRLLIPYINESFRCLEVNLLCFIFFFVCFIILFYTFYSVFLFFCVCFFCLFFAILFVCLFVLPILGPNDMFFLLAWNKYISNQLLLLKRLMRSWKMGNVFLFFSFVFCLFVCLGICGCMSWFVSFVQNTKKTENKCMYKRKTIPGFVQ